MGSITRSACGFAVASATFARRRHVTAEGLRRRCRGSGFWMNAFMNCIACRIGRRRCRATARNSGRGRRARHRRSSRRTRSRRALPDIDRAALTDIGPDHGMILIADAVGVRIANAGTVAVEAACRSSPTLLAPARLRTDRKAPRGIEGASRMPAATRSRPQIASAYASADRSPQSCARLDDGRSCAA